MNCTKVVILVIYLRGVPWCNSSLVLSFGLPWEVVPCGCGSLTTRGKYLYLVLYV
jgi:hypothetical protein